MKKVAVFYGSPRKNGVSNKLAEQVGKGAKDAGAEVVVYDLNQEGVRGCQSCFFCRGKDMCAVKDPLTPMYDDIKEACGIVASFPIYFFNITAQGKLWIDRLYPMINGDFSPRHPGKKVVTLYAQANSNAEEYKEPIAKNDAIFGTFGWDVIDSIIAADTMNPEFNMDDLMARAYEAGKNLVK